MTMVNDDWIRTAMTDDDAVVHLLLRLKTSLPSKHREIQSLPFTWGLRQPRSRSRLAPSSRCCDAAVSARCSPTTPLSWSGGASPSVTPDGCEDSSLHHAARSKATATSGYTGHSASASIKKCRKKKTFAELKEEESYLLKERTHLTKEIAQVNANFEAQRAKNESLKRMKLDFDSKSHEQQQCRLSGQPHKRIIPLPSVALTQASEPFLIPDLNMPADEGMS